MVSLAAGAGLVAGWLLGPYVRSAGARLPRWAVALGAAAVCALAVVRAAGPGVAALRAALALGLWLIAAIDLHAYRIPNPLVLAIALLGLAAQVFGRGPAGAWASLLAGLTAGGAFTALTLVTRGGFGWGDAKLAAALAWVLGPPHALAALLVAMVAGGLGAGLLVLTRRRGLRDAVPFAPFFLVGGLWVLLIPSAHA